MPISETSINIKNFKLPGGVPGEGGRGGISEWWNRFRDSAAKPVGTELQKVQQLNAKPENLSCITTMG